MVTESEFSKAVEEFKTVLKGQSMQDQIESTLGIDNAINSLNSYVRAEFKEFAAIPESLLGIHNHIKDLRNWKLQNETGFNFVNKQKDATVGLIKNYLQDVGRQQHFAAISW